MDHHSRSSTWDIRFTCVPGCTQTPRMAILSIYCKFDHKTVYQCLFYYNIQVAGEDRMWVNMTFLTGSDQEKAYQVRILSRELVLYVVMCRIAEFLCRKNCSLKLLIVLVT